MDPRFELTKANWMSYYGNNCIQIEKPKVWAGGGVSFTEHIGKPLSQRLWEDLMHRLLITGLCIYKPDSVIWTTDWMGGHCCLFLDANENVKHIYYIPVQR